MNSLSSLSKPNLYRSHCDPHVLEQYTQLNHSMISQNSTSNNYKYERVGNIFKIVEVSPKREELCQ